MKTKDENKRALLQRLRLRSLMRDTRGLNTVEYAILLVLIVVVSYKLWDTFGGKVKSGVENANKTIQIESKGADGSN